MPVKDCQEDNKSGYKWGDSGKCYTYSPNNEGSKKNAKKSATIQGLTYDEFNTIGEITCKNCGWQWNISDGGNDPYICHKCGYDNQETDDRVDIKLEGLRVSFDYDDTLTTSKGKELLKKELAENNIIYIISARDRKTPMLKLANELGVSTSRVYATGSNTNKVQKLKDLDIVRHYDNSDQVIDIASKRDDLKTKIIKV